MSQGKGRELERSSLASPPSCGEAADKQRQRGWLRHHSGDVKRPVVCRRDTGNATGREVAGLEGASGEIGEAVGEIRRSGSDECVGLVIGVGQYESVSAGPKSERHEDVAANGTANARADGDHAGGRTALEAGVGVVIQKRVGGAVDNLSRTVEKREQWVKAASGDDLAASVHTATEAVSLDGNGGGGRNVEGELESVRGASESSGEGEGICLRFNS